MPAPVIGITCDNKENTAASRRYESPIAYSRAIVAAGGLPVLLPHEVSLVGEYAKWCAGILLTGGADLRMERFGQAMHPQAKPVDERRQEFELALLDEMDRRREIPVLGVCMGMQLMAMHAGGKLNQHLPDTLGDQGAAIHQGDNRHAIVPVALSPLFPPLVSHSPSANSPTAPSWHHQAVADPGRLRVVATAPDGVIEAVDDPARPFYLGVQWHPERGGEGPLNSALLVRFVDACRRPKA